MSDDDSKEPRDEDPPGEDRELRLRDEPDRQSWLSTYGSALFRAAILLVLLVALIVLRKPCADGMAGFVGNFGDPARSVAPRDGGAARPAAGDAAPRQ